MSEFTIKDNPNTVAVLTAPRLCFTHFALSLSSTLTDLSRDRAIGLVSTEGAFWEQCITNALEQAIEQGADYIITLDYDSVFQTQDVLDLIAHMNARPDLAVIYPTQANRHYDNIMCPQDGLDYSTPLTEKIHGHFGLTIIRAEVFERLEKPWFWNMPGEDGRWQSPERIDADIAFWKELDLRGMKAAQANDVCIGHLELMVRWPFGDKIGAQSARDYQKNGKPKAVCWHGDLAPKPELEAACP